MSKNQIDINVENCDLYLTIDKKFLDSVLSKAAKVYDENDQENGDGSLQGSSYMFKVNLHQASCDVEEDQFFVTYETENGEILLNLTHKFDELDHVKLAEVIIKKLNKAKALFETLR